MEAHEYSSIRGISCDVILKDKKWYSGEYMFTLSWFGNSLSEDSGDGGFKRAHIIKLDNGCYAAQPNNRIRWYEGSFITKPFPKNPDYVTNSHNWKCEDGKKWATEDTDKYFYQYQEKTA